MGTKKTIISTLMPDQFSKFEHFMGQDFELLNYPMIRIQNLEPDENSFKILSQLNQFNWLIFTSMRGVSGFYSFIQKANIQNEEYNKIRIACIGKTTADELKVFGPKADYINPGNTSAEFAGFLLKDVLNPKDKILLIQGERADNQFEEKLINSCQVDRLNVYQTLDIADFNSGLNDMIVSDNYELLVFTSPSGFESFLSVYKYQTSETNLKIASIGMKTTKAIEYLGFKVTLTAEKSDLEGLAEEIKKRFGA